MATRRGMVQQLTSARLEANIICYTAAASLQITTEWQLALGRYSTKPLRKPAPTGIRQRSNTARRHGSGNSHWANLARWRLTISSVPYTTAVPLHMQSYGDSVMFLKVAEYFTAMFLRTAFLQWYLAGGMGQSRCSQWGCLRQGTGQP